MHDIYMWITFTPYSLLMIWFAVGLLKTFILTVLCFKHLKKNIESVDSWAIVNILAGPVPVLPAR